MNMKRMTTAAMALVVGALMADVNVEDSKCTHRYPWNGLVDIEYTIACDDPEAEIYVNPVGFNGDTGLTVFPTHFTGDGATNTVKAGRHTMVWDAKADMGNLFATKNFQIKMYAGKKLSRYIVIDISGGTEAETYPIRHSIEGPNLDDDTCRTTEIWMRLIPPGTFMMGSPEDELGRNNNEDLHKVTFTKPFYLGVFEVTCKQWELVCGTFPVQPTFSTAVDKDVRPVDAQYLGSASLSMRGRMMPTADTGFSDSFVSRLRVRTNTSAFDLPSESRWEYACRAGSLAALYNGDNISGPITSTSLGEVAAYYGNRYNEQSYNSGSTVVGTMRVGSYEPNALGLYDMLGNVWEVCRDGVSAYSASSANIRLGYDDVVDPRVGAWDQRPNAGDSKAMYVVRGGCWQSMSIHCRCARRDLVMFGNDYSVTSSGKAYLWKESGTGRNAAHVGFRVCAETDF